MPIVIITDENGESVTVTSEFLQYLLWLVLQIREDAK